LAALALVGVSVIGTQAISTPAQASLNDCGGGWFCVWTGYQGTGTMCKWSASEINSSKGVWMGEKGCDNNTHTWWNRSSTAFQMNDARTCNQYATGFKRTLNPGQIAYGEGSDWIHRFSAIVSFTQTGTGACGYA
jgi:hypothetical protein